MLYLVHNYILMFLLGFCRLGIKHLYILVLYTVDRVLSFAGLILSIELGAVREIRPNRRICICMGLTLS